MRMLVFSALGIAPPGSVSMGMRMLWPSLPLSLSSSRIM